jgi:hypothetical protein
LRWDLPEGPMRVRSRAGRDAQRLLPPRAFANLGLRKPRDVARLAIRCSFCLGVFCRKCAAAHFRHENEARLARSIAAELRRLLLPAVKKLAPTLRRLDKAMGPVTRARRGSSR